MSEAILEVKNLVKTFGHHEVLKGIDFEVCPGDVTSIIGSSGSGKSTFLRCINLLETPTGGSILYHGEDIMKPGFNQAKYRARVGMVFQSFNLFNNKTALENCVIGQVKVLKRDKKAVSYTHLGAGKNAHPNTAVIDVEGEGGRKLSVQASSTGGGRIMINMLDGIEVNCTCEMPTLIVHNLDPVSYTHLDVYKRQVYMLRRGDRAPYGRCGA